MTASPREPVRSEPGSSVESNQMILPLLEPERIAVIVRWRQRSPLLTAQHPPVLMVTIPTCNPRVEHQVPGPGVETIHCRRPNKLAWSQNSVKRRLHGRQRVSGVLSFEGGVIVGVHLRQQAVAVDKSLHRHRIHYRTRHNATAPIESCWKDPRSRHRQQGAELVNEPLCPIFTEDACARHPRKLKQPRPVVIGILDPELLLRTQWLINDLISADNLNRRPLRGHLASLSRAH